MDQHEIMAYFAHESFQFMDFKRRRMWDHPLWTQ